MQTTLYPSYREYIRLGLVRSKTQRRVEGTHVQHTCVGDVTPPRRVGGLLPSDASPAVCVWGGGGMPHMLGGTTVHKGFIGS